MITMANKGANINLHLLYRETKPDIFPHISGKRRVRKGDVLER